MTNEIRRETVCICEKIALLYFAMSLAVYGPKAVFGYLDGVFADASKAMDFMFMASFACLATATVASCLVSKVLMPLRAWSVR